MTNQNETNELEIALAPFKAELVEYLLETICDEDAQDTLKEQVDQYFDEAMAHDPELFISYLQGQEGVDPIDYLVEDEARMADGMSQHLDDFLVGEVLFSVAFVCSLLLLCSQTCGPVDR